VGGEGEARTSEGTPYACGICRSTSTVRRSMRHKSPWSNDVSRHSSRHVTPFTQLSTIPPASRLRCTGKSMFASVCASLRSHDSCSKSLYTASTRSDGRYLKYALLAL